MIDIKIPFNSTLLVLSDILELAFIAPETKRVLERLSHMPDVNVTIISGREMNDLRKKVSHKHLYFLLYISWDNNNNSKNQFIF